MKNKSIVLLALVFLIIRILVSFRFELGTDEAHYVLYGTHLDLSYFDHPPLVGWIHHLFFALSQILPLEIFARLPAILSSAVATLLINEWLQRKNYSEQNRFLGLLALNISILFSALSLFFLPDTLLFILVPLLSMSVENVMKERTLKNWIYLGLVLGLCGLTKYTAVLFLIPIAWYWVKNNRLKDLISPSFWTAVIFAAAIVSPVLIWNLKHDFISFKYQTGHVISFQTINFIAFLAAQASQFLGLSLMYFFCFPKTKNLQDRFDFYLILTPLLFFSFFSLFENFLPHWTAPFFILAIPWGIADYAQKNGLTKKLKAAFAVASLLFVFIHLELGLHFLPFSASRDLQRDIQGWRAFTQRSLSKSQLPLAVTNWTFGSRIKLYSELQRRPNVIVLDHRIDQFDLWSAEYPPTTDYLMLVERKNEPEFLNSIQCQNQKNLGADGPQYKDQTLVEFDLIECTGFSWK